MEKLTKQQIENTKREIARQKRIVIKAFWQSAVDTGETDVMAGRTWRTHHDPETLYTYTSDEIQIAVCEDGAISLFADGAESHIYFYPDQLKYLQKALRKALAQK